MTSTKNFAEYIQTQIDADPALAIAVAEEAINAHIAQQVYDLRMAAKLTQKELAERIGTQQSVISRIEDADYEGHSLGMLKRIAEALGKKLRIEFYDPEPRAPESRPTVLSTSTTAEATTEAVFGESEFRFARFLNGFAPVGLATGGS